MAHRYHLSIDDVFGAVMQLSDWDLSIPDQPMLAFLARLARDHGAVTDLYLFERLTAPDGRVRDLGEVRPEAAERLSGTPALRYGPHARDYATPPHAQTPDELAQDMERLCAKIARFAPAERRSAWVRLHYFSEAWEAAEVWRRHGVEALMTTDRPAVAYRLGAAERAALSACGRAEHEGVGFITSHLRFERHLDDADDPARFSARIDAALDRHGFVTLFTHEIDLDDPRTRRLMEHAVGYLSSRGVTPV